MNIIDFAARPSSFPFGIRTNEEIADTLEAFAKGVRNGRFCLQRVEIYDRAEKDDYMMRTLGVTFADQRPQESFNPDQWPVQTDDPEVPVPFSETHLNGQQPNYSERSSGI